MPRYTLVIGNKNGSSWSLRPWLVMKAFGIPFSETRLYVMTVLASQEQYRRIYSLAPPAAAAAATGARP